MYIINRHATDQIWDYIPPNREDWEDFPKRQFYIEPKPTGSEMPKPIDLKHNVLPRIRDGPIM